MEENIIETGLTRDERKAQRRDRLQIKQQGTGIADNVNTVNSTEIVGQKKAGNLSGKVLESAQNLAKFQSEALENLTNIRVAADENESLRRKKSNHKFEVRSIRLDDEANSSAEISALIENKWADMMNENIPQELQRELKEQMKLCEEVIKSKQALVTEFKSNIREQDEEYVNTLRKQTKDLQLLIAKTDETSIGIKSQYEGQLGNLQEYCRLEREALVTSHAKEVHAIMEKRHEKEKYYVADKLQREEKYKKETDELIAKGVDDYNKLKIELESNIQTLNQQLEEIKATYQLNSEKLEYNFRVLTELNGEKLVEREKCKRKATKVKDQLNLIMAKYQDTEKSYGKSSSGLTEDYRELTKRYKDLQAKFKHFELADTEKYRQVCAMHVDELKDTVRQLVSVDRAVAESHLEVQWQAPDLSVLDRFEEEARLAAHTGATDVGVPDEDPSEVNLLDEAELLQRDRQGDTRDFWRAVEEIIPDDTVALWRQLTKDTVNMKSLLDRRSKCLHKLTDLQAENLNLKRELDRCLGDTGFNAQFQVAPVLALQVPPPARKSRSASRTTPLLPPLGKTSTGAKTASKSREELW